jgi:pyridoxal phosphate enzyme (YggS family)
MKLQLRIQEIQKRIEDAAVRSGRKSSDVTLLAVTKTFSVEQIQEAYDLGLRQFGENRVQEALGKIERLPRDIQWHLIGQLQTNKVNKVLERFNLIHSVDSIKLAQALSARLEKDQDILLEVNTSGEPTKAGFSSSEILDFVSSIDGLPHLKIRGLMTIGPLTDFPEKRREAFKRLRELFLKVKNKIETEKDFSVLSMGMSGDFEVAIEEGATIVRIGKALFGERY